MIVVMLLEFGEHTVTELASDMGPGEPVGSSSSSPTTSLESRADVSVGLGEHMDILASLARGEFVPEEESLL